MKPVVMPALGVAMTEGLVLRWLKQPGEAVAEGEPILEIETDKSTVEVPSPAHGRVGPLLAAEGDMVPTGVALTHVLEGSEEPAAQAPAPAAGGRRGASGPIGASAERPAASAGTVTGDHAPVPARTVAGDRAGVSAGTVAGERAPNRLSPRQRRIAREQAAAPDRDVAESTTGIAAATVGPPLGGAPQGLSGTHPADTGAGSLLSIELQGIDPAAARAWLRTMLLIREFESRLDALSMSGKVTGGVHLSIGQEAVAVGIVAGLEQVDLVACGHRSHHHAIAKGMGVRGIMAELFGRAGGSRGGRGGTMHLSDSDLGFLGGNGIVGAGLGVAMGAALAARLRASGQVSVGIFGEGGANTGRTWESINLAAAWRLPLIAVCENNLYAVETPSASLTGGGSVVNRAAGFGLPAFQVDGQDVAAVARIVGEARRRAASGEGPTFIEALTYRYEGHSTGQVINYRTAQEVQDWRDTRDPIARLRQALVSSGGLTEQEHEALVAAVRSEVDEAIAFAEASPLPDPSEATRGVTGLELEAWGL